MVSVKPYKLSISVKLKQSHRLDLKTSMSVEPIKINRGSRGVVCFLSGEELKKSIKGKCLVEFKGLCGLDPKVKTGI